MPSQGLPEFVWFGAEAGGDLDAACASRIGALPGVARAAPWCSESRCAAGAG
jgi:hypothetical protein